MLMLMGSRGVSVGSLGRFAARASKYSNVTISLDAQDRETGSDLDDFNRQRLSASRAEDGRESVGAGLRRWRQRARHRVCNKKRNYIIILISLYTTFLRHILRIRK